MNEHIDAYPLTWPDGWVRTDCSDQIRAKFSKRSGNWQKQLSASDATQRVLETLDRMGVDWDDIVISTNIPLRLDGLPKSGQAAPGDPGVAVYWRRNGETRCMAIDRYDRVEDNIAAVAATLEAMRSIERHGGAEILDRAFTGFVSLPAPMQWWHVFGCKSASEMDLTELRRRYRKLAMVRHPDRATGSHEAMAELSWAYKEGRSRLSGRV